LPRLFHSLAQHLGNAGAEILEHYHHRVAAWGARDRAAGMRGRAGLVEAGDGHLVIRPAGNGTHQVRLCGVHLPAVNAAVPEIGIAAPDVERRLAEAGEDFVVGEIRREAPGEVQKLVGRLFLDHVPMLRPLLQIEGREGEEIHRVHAFRGPGRVEHGHAGHRLVGRLEINFADGHVVSEFEEALGRIEDERFGRNHGLSVLQLEFGRLGEGVVREEGRRLALPQIDVGDEVHAIVSKDRNSIKKNHTATHVLQWALQQVLGKSVAQQGSYVGPDYLRFDFTYPKAPSSEQLKQIENLVREKIGADLPVTWTIMPKEQAQKLGAMALFGEKYGQEVRVVALGAGDKNEISEAFSREFCGGTHVDRLGVIGGFKIIKEESISAGVRRITALTGTGLTAYLEKAGDIVDELSAMLKIPSESLVERVGQLLKDNKKLTKDLKAAARQSGSDSMAEARRLLEKCEKVGDASIIIGRLSTTSIEQAREAVDMLKKKAKSAAIVLGFDDDGRATLLAGMTDDLVAKGLKADDIVREIAPIVDGGGGGRPQMAQAGGKDPKKISDALARAGEIVKQKLDG